MHNPELPKWDSASHVYSKAYAILHNMAMRKCVSRKWMGIRMGYICYPNEDVNRLVAALHSGNEETIKGLLLQTHVYY